MPPSVPLNHYLESENQQNRTEVLFHYSMHHYSSAYACFKHSNFFKVNVLVLASTLNKEHEESRIVARRRSSAVRRTELDRPEIQLRAF